MTNAKGSTPHQHELGPTERRCTWQYKVARIGCHTVFVQCTDVPLACSSHRKQESVILTNHGDFAYSALKQSHDNAACAAVLLSFPATCFGGASFIFAFMLSIALSSPPELEFSAILSELAVPQGHVIDIEPGYAAHQRCLYSKPTRGRPKRERHVLPFATSTSVLLTQLERTILPAKSL